MDKLKTGIKSTKSWKLARTAMTQNNILYLIIDSMGAGRVLFPNDDN